MPRLVLSRKANERIVIGDDVTITVTDIGHGVVKLMVEAPRNTEVWRAEILPADHPQAPKPAN
jgi:carbon storage regulator